MAREAKAVIGANYGDEAKGANVDRLTSGPDTLVVRFNGGGQAGHTVVAPDGRRHVFHHVGSGAFRGAATFLSRHFVSNPMVLLQEVADLAALGVAPTILADARGLVTTPYDMLLNQVVETRRGGGRHGSTGLGFGETIERAERGFGTTMADLTNAGVLAATLRRVRDEWVPRRLATLGVVDVPEEYAHFLAGDDMVDAFLDAAGQYLAAVRVADPSVLSAAPEVVFEGAQGLMLDQDRGDFPHVTRSNTGLLNAIDVAREAGIASIDATYATRCYLTRHGAGPLPGEVHEPPVPGFADATNVPNPWQGTLRFAVLDADTLAERIRTDLSDATGSGVSVRAGLAVSCLDQADGTVPLALDGRVRDVPVGDFARTLAGQLGVGRATSAFGSGRDDVHHAKDGKALAY